MADAYGAQLTHICCGLKYTTQHLIFRHPAVGGSMPSVQACVVLIWCNVEHIGSSYHEWLWGAT